MASVISIFLELEQIEELFIHTETKKRMLKVDYLDMLTKNGTT